MGAGEGAFQASLGWRALTIRLGELFPIAVTELSSAPAWRLPAGVIGSL